MDKYEYGDGAPDLGYGEAVPDSEKYGYEDPDEVARRHAFPISTKNPRRPSLKKVSTIGNYSTGQRVLRRNSIQVYCKPESEASTSTAAAANPGRSARRRTSVGFLGTVEEIPAPPPPSSSNNNNNSDLPSDANPQQGDEWIREEELNKIRKDNAKIIKYTETGATDKKFCLRGLEGMLSTSTQEMERRAARQVVLEEQRLQREQGIVDADRISERYRMIAMQSKFEAAERAETDSGDIEGYVRKERKQWLSAKAPPGGLKSRMSRRMSC